MVVRTRSRFFFSLVVFGLFAAITLMTVWIFRVSATTTNATRSVAMDEYGKHFEIMYYWGPSGEQINSAPSAVAGNIANAGFTIAPIRGSWSSQWQYDALPAAIATLDSYKLKTYVFEGSNGDLAVADNPETFYNSYIKPYTNYKNVVGYDITDEPSINTSGGWIGLDTANVAVTRLNTLDPMRDSYVNLFPNYASESCLQNKTTGCDAQGDLNLATYETYLATYFNNSAVRTLSVDYYPKANNNLTNTYSGYSDRDLYYSNLRSVLYHYKAKRNLNIEAVPMNIVALHDWYVDASTASQVRYQVSTNLAFGMKRMSYFTYMQPAGVAWSTGWLVEDGGVTTAGLMTTVSNVNAWTFNLGNELYTKEVGTVDQVYGTNMARMYRDEGIADNAASLGTVTAMSGSEAAQAVVTSFDDGSIYIANGEPNKQITVTWTGSVSLSSSAIYNANAGTWSGCYPILCSGAANSSVTLPAGGNILFYPGAGISNNTGVVVDRANRKVVSYSNRLADVVDNVTATGKSLSGTTLTLAGETYNVLYLTSETCTIRPAFVWTGMNSSYASCGITTNSQALTVGQVDSNYMYVKYNYNGGQVKNIPILSGTVADYTVTGGTIKTNGAEFDMSKVSIKNGVAEQTGNSLKIYTWPGKILVATYSIDTSAPVVDHAYFTDITLSSGTLSSGFEPETLTYSVSVPYGVANLTVTGVGNATYGVSDVAVTKSLTAGAITSFVLTATDENSYSRVYTVNVTRAAPPVDHAYFTDIEVWNGQTELPALIDFVATTTIYSISVGYEVSELTIKGIGSTMYGVGDVTQTKSLPAGETTGFTLVATDENEYSRTYTVNVTRDNPPEDHAYFTDITLSSGELSSGFEPETLTYNVEVPYSVANVTVTGVGNAAYGVASVTQTKDLTAGETTGFTLTAIDENEYKRTYTVNVTRGEAPVDHAYFTAVNLTAGTIDFMPTTTTYAVAVSYDVENLTITGVGNAAYGVADVTLTKSLTPGGVTNFTLTAIDENNYERDYVFYVTRASAPVDHAYFTDITLSNGELSPGFEQETLTYNVRVTNDVASLTVTGVGNATYGVSDVAQTKNLTPGEVKEFVLTATDKNEFSRDYTVRVYREPDVVPTVDHAYFTNITVSEGELTPGFAAGTLEYNVGVSYTVETIDVRATGNATYGVADVEEIGVALTPGRAKTVTLTAVDENNYTRDYEVIITRELPSTNADLSLLEVTYKLDGESKTAKLIPDFSPTTYIYAATVPDEATEVAYSYSLSDPLADATGTALGEVTVMGTTVKINTLAQDKETRQEYTLTITREPPATIEMVGVAKSQRTNDKELAAGRATVVETVQFVNLKKNTTYKLKAGLKTSTGETVRLASGEEAQTETFTTLDGVENFRETTELVFDSTPYVGESVVVWLELFDNDDNSLARLDALDSPAQTVSVVRPTMGSVLTMDEGLKNTVTYTGLARESVYTIRSELWRVDEDGGKLSLAGSAVKSFTASTENDAMGEVIEFEFKAEETCRLKAFSGLYYALNTVPFVTSESDAILYEVEPEPEPEPEPESESGDTAPKVPDTGEMWKDGGYSRVLFGGGGAVVALFGLYLARRKSLNKK